MWNNWGAKWHRFPLCFPASVRPRCSPGTSFGDWSLWLPYDTRVVLRDRVLLPFSGEELKVIAGMREGGLDILLQSESPLSSQQRHCFGTSWLRLRASARGWDPAAWQGHNRSQFGLAVRLSLPALLGDSSCSWMNRPIHGGWPE